MAVIYIYAIYAKDLGKATCKGLFFQKTMFYGKNHLCNIL
jgi:hypothetical protein